MRLDEWLRSANLTVIGNNQNIFFSPRHYDHFLLYVRQVSVSSFPTGPLQDHGELQCHWTVFATKQIRQRVLVQTCCILHGPDEQSLTRGG